MRQAIHSLYVLKAIGAFLVVACHIPMIGGGALLGTLLNVAVPIFYAISGYFLYAPDAQQSLRRALSSARKLVPVILIVNLIHFLWLLPQHADMALGVDLVKLLVYGDALIGHLWYLNAMLWAMLILALLLWRGWGTAVPFLCLLGLLNCLHGRYASLFGTPSNVFTVLHYALPFIALGYTIARYERRLLTFRQWHVVLLAVLALGVIEAWLLERLGISGLGIYLTTPLLTLSALMTMLGRKSLGQGSLLERVGREDSSYVYYFHILIGTVVGKAMSLVGLTDLYSALGAVFVFVASVLVGEVIVRAQRRLGIRLL